MPTNLRREESVSLNAALARPRPARRWIGLAALALGAIGLVGWSAYQRETPVQSLLLSAINPGRAPQPHFKADCSKSPAALQQQLDTLAGTFDGQFGIAVTKAGCKWLAGTRQDEFFPQQSVSKLWVSLTMLDAWDHGRIGLDDPLSIGPADLTLFHQPLRAEVAEKGVAVRPVAALMHQALTQSDNTANDRLLWAVGGPDKVRQVLKRMEIEGVRFGPGERLLQSQAAGLVWRQDMALGNNFEIARARLPLADRQAALQRYLAAPPDGASAAGIARALARLAAGELLSPQATDAMMNTLAKTHSGPRRLKAGAPKGWQVFHKTGTGQELRGVSTGYNDVGLLKAPDGSIYSVAVMIGETRRPIQERMALMQAVSAAVGQFHQAGQ